MPPFPKQALILGNFVVERVWQEGALQLSGGATAGNALVNHTAHLAGALAGVMLIALLSSLPAADDKSS